MKQRAVVPSYQQNVFSISAEVEKGGNVNLGPQVSIYTTEEGREFEIKRKYSIVFHLRQITLEQFTSGIGS